MKILLVEAPFSYEEALIKKGERFLPLGIASIAGFVKKEVPSVDLKVFVDDMPDFERILEEFRPDVVGISAMTTNYPCCSDLAKMVKRHNPSVFVVVGGQHASSVGAQVLEDIPEVDFICIGEGEKFLGDLVREIQKGGQDWRSVRGIGFRENGDIILGEPVLPHEDLDTLPFPARELFDLNRFRSHDFMRFGSKTVSMISSRGCPARCSFCSSFVTMGRKYRLRSAENVIEEVEGLIRDHNVDGIIFWDDAFTFKRDRVVRFCELIKARGIKVKWWCMSRVDAINDALAALMAGAGCVMISFGIESGSPETLKKIHKYIDLGAVTAAIRSCRKAGIRTQGTFILGLPFEEMGDIDATIKFALSSGLHMALFFSFTPFPGTEEWQHVEEGDKPKHFSDWHKFVCNAGASKSWNKRFTDDEIKKIVMRAHRRFYLRPAQVLRILGTIRTWKEFSYYFNGGVDFIFRLVKEKTRC